MEAGRVGAQGLLRWRRRMQAAGFDATSQSPEILADRLELPDETRLSVPDDKQRDRVYAYDNYLRILTGEAD